MTFLQKFAPGIIGILVVALGASLYLYKTTLDTLTLTQNEYRTTKADLEANINSLEANLKTQIQEKIALEGGLQDEKRRNDGFADQINEISGTVGVLEKLSKTDAELLQKYSKVSFLNEHYVPSQLADIEKNDLYSESVSQQIHARVLPYMERMINDADDDGVTLYIRSAYRSFGTQSVLKNSYTVSYGSGANQFSADQGFSEHQLGTTIDFTTTGLNGNLTGFENTKAYTWLVKNAYEYGFTLSYPEGNAYYVFEPWHWRFVGTDLATRLHRNNQHFYDLDQRSIDEYLVDIFD